MSDTALYKYLGELLLAELDLVGRGSHRTFACDFEELARRTKKLRRDLKTVYTAFDGDHQHLTPLMRKFVMKHGKVPVNPDSVLDYRETLRHRKSKRGVLLDDIAILNGCDELWIFTDLPPKPTSLPELAEGVLVEMLYFLKRRPQGDVVFVPLAHLLRAGLEGHPHEHWVSSYEESKSFLAANQREAVLAIANGMGTVDKVLPHVWYHIFDLADFKYARFLLPPVYEKAESEGRRSAPLVPYLALSVTDVGLGEEALGRLVLAWAKLIELSSHGIKLNSVEPGRSPSVISRWLEAVWRQCKKRDRPLLQGNWNELGIPKVDQRELWAITPRERRRFS